MASRFSSDLRLLPAPAPLLPSWSVVLCHWRTSDLPRQVASGGIVVAAVGRPRLIRGEALGAWGLTEAGAGSDAAGMRTTATRQGHEWVLNGAKSFITHGRIGGVMVVIAVTDRTLGHRGISAFVVEHGTPGMAAGKKENKLGMRASDTSEVICADCHVPASQLLGSEGQGFVNTLKVLDAGRIAS